MRYYLKEDLELISIVEMNKEESVKYYKEYKPWPSKGEEYFTMYDIKVKFPGDIISKDGKNLGNEMSQQLPIDTYYIKDQCGELSNERFIGNLGLDSIYQSYLWTVGKYN